MKQKRSHVLAQLVLALVLLVAVTRTWVTYELGEGAAAVSSIAVAGQEGLAATLPVAIALVAIAVTLGIAGRGFRIALAVVTIVLGAWVSIASAGVTFGDERATLRFGVGPLQEATGLAASDHPEMVAAVAVSAWPLVTVVIGALIALMGLTSAVVGWSWSRGGAKYETKREKAPQRLAGDRISDWDALSIGDDPSDDTTLTDGSPNSKENR